jgi:hypothetical protein
MMDDMDDEQVMPARDLREAYLHHRTIFARWRPSKIARPDAITS